MDSWGLFVDVKLEFVILIKRGNGVETADHLVCGLPQDRT